MRRVLPYNRRLTHNDLASLAGVVRETVTKVLNDLKDEELIEHEGRRLIIRNAASLKSVVYPLYSELLLNTPPS